MANPDLLEAIERGTHGNPNGRPAHGTTRLLNAAAALAGSTAPTSNNNNNVNKLGHSVPARTALTAAVNNLSSITSINANINVIQLKTELTTTEQTIKAENEVIYNNLTSDDLSILDNSLTLDPALNDLALQHGFFDDLASDDFSLEDMQCGGSPLSFSFTTNGLSSSPLTIQTAHAVSGIKEERVDLSSLGNTIRINGSGTPTANVATSGGSYILSRTVSAFT
jgi:hypothetical protein